MHLWKKNLIYYYEHTKPQTWIHRNARISTLYLLSTALSLFCVHVKFTRSLICLHTNVNALQSSHGRTVYNLLRPNQQLISLNLRLTFFASFSVTAQFPFCKIASVYYGVRLGVGQCEWTIHYCHTIWMQIENAENKFKRFHSSRRRVWMSVSKNTLWIRISLCITHHIWMVSEGLPRPSNTM